jgi:tetratricopeptide (TPR) repeat protein
MNSRKLLLVASVLCLLSTGSVNAHEEEDGKGKLGSVAFANSCDPKVQESFLRGVAMLHSFWYSEAEKTFREVLARDPSCAIATWGVASILMSNPLAGFGASPKGAEQSQAMIELGRRIGAKTQRERDYIEAAAAYYEDWSNRSERLRQQARSKAYEALAARYPDDDEAQIFSALYIAGTQTQADQTYAAYLKAAAILEKQFVKHPDHPGVAHYLIHSYDAPPIAQQGLTAARRYADIAPAAPHALHMPSHIFTRVGSWEESVAANKHSADAAKKGGEPDESFHASDYMTYAYLQLAQDGNARRSIEEAMRVTDFSAGRNVAPYAIAMMPARYAIERGAWNEATQLQAQTTKFHFPEAMTYFARALGAVRSGDLAAAEKDAENLAAMQKALLAENNTYWANEVETQRLAVAGWIALGRGKPDDALKLMRAAADNEDRSEKHIVTPGRVVPARELLGEMLLELKQPAQALKEFEASQQREPNRFRGTYDAARAAQAAGDRQKATEYFVKLVALGKNSDGTRPELVLAKAYIAER